MSWVSRYDQNLLFHKNYFKKKNQFIFFYFKYIRKAKFLNCFKVKKIIYFEKLDTLFPDSASKTAKLDAVVVFPTL